MQILRKLIISQEELIEIFLRVTMEFFLGKVFKRNCQIPLEFRKRIFNVGVFRNSGFLERLEDFKAILDSFHELFLGELAI